MTQAIKPHPPASGVGADIVWEGPHDRVVLSPRHGGRVVAWSHRGSANLVREPQQFEGGLLRTLLRAEGYPGKSFSTAHLVVNGGEKPRSVHLRYFWDTANIFARLFGWTEKISPHYLDGLLLDKVVTFHPETSALSVDLTISNVSGSPRQIVPWVQNTFREILGDFFVVRDGIREEYKRVADYWLGHPRGSAKTMRMVQGNREGTLFAVLGAKADQLVGMEKYDPVDFGPGATLSIQELRYQPIHLAVGECWRANYFVALTEDSSRWTTDSPVELYSGTQPAAANWKDKDILPALEGWAVEQERESGLMVVSFLDKLPFTSSNRFNPAHAIAGFHAGRNQPPRAAVVLFALKELTDVRAALSCGKGWRLLDEDGQPVPASFYLKKYELRRLIVEAAPGLRGKDAVSLRFASGRAQIAKLHVPADAAVEPLRPYQFKQMATHLDERFRREKLEFTGTTAREFKAWQSDQRKRYQKWIRDSVIGPCPLEPRLLERQIGPTCVRDKIAIQTEPGMWLPSYVVYPKNRRKGAKKMPALILFHGSGPGKLAYAPDENPAEFIPDSTHELYGMPYALAQKMNCLVYVPDQRSQGEWGEMYSTEAARRTGYNPWAMRAWDHTRSLDYLCSRPDVDALRIGCFGASGGGSATMYTAGIDTRIRAAILSSMPPYLAIVPDQLFSDPEAISGFDDGWQPLTNTPSIPANVCTMTIPRPLWMMDGTHDECWGSPRAPDAEEVYAKARARWQAARDEIARMYKLAGASDKLRQTWFPGGHCAGMTVANVVEWFTRWF